MALIPFVCAPPDAHLLTLCLLRCCADGGGLQIEERKAKLQEVDSMEAPQAPATPTLKALNI